MSETPKNPPPPKTPPPPKSPPTKPPRRTAADGRIFTSVDELLADLQTPGPVGAAVAPPAVPGLDCTLAEAVAVMDLSRSELGALSMELASLLVLVGDADHVLRVALQLARRRIDQLLNLPARPDLLTVDLGIATTGGPGKSTSREEVRPALGFEAASDHAADGSDGLVVSLVAGARAGGAGTPPAHNFSLPLRRAVPGFDAADPPMPLPPPSPGPPPPPIPRPSSAFPLGDGPLYDALPVTGAKPKPKPRPVPWPRPPVPQPQGGELGSAR